MAEAQSALQRSGLTRGKAALVGVLAVVLVGVVYMQYGPSDAELSSEPVAYTPRRVAPAIQSATPTIEQKQSQIEPENTLAVAALVDETRWKSPELADVIDYDPLALPAAFPQPPQAIDTSGAGGEGLVAAAAANDAKRLAEAVERLQMQLEELKQRGVHIIVRERDQYVAMIGDQTVHVGDEINGFTVTEIDPTGVRVERKVPQ